MPDLSEEDTAIIGSEIRELLIRHPSSAYMRGCQLVRELEQRAEYYATHEQSGALDPVTCGPELDALRAGAKLAGRDEPPE